MKIERPAYVQQLVESKDNGLIKIVTGLRRVGKSYLLKTLFKEYLLKEGVSKDHILIIDLEDRKQKAFKDPDYLLDWVDKQMKDDGQYYKLGVGAHLEEVVYLCVERGPVILLEVLPDERVVAVRMPATVDRVGREKAPEGYAHLGEVLSALELRAEAAVADILLAHATIDKTGQQCGRQKSDHLVFVLEMSKGGMVFCRHLVYIIA